MSNSAEKEILGYVYNLLNTDSELKTASGLDPTMGTARPVSVYNQPPQNKATPYVRITLTDASVIGEEPYGYTYTPTARSIGFMVDVVSDYEPECLSISSRVQRLLQHNEVTTANYHGSTWLSQPTQYFTDNTSNPERVYCRGSIRVLFRVEET